MKNIVLISKNNNFMDSLSAMIKSSYNITNLDSVSNLFECCFSSMPDLILLTDDAADPTTAEITATIKADPLFGNLPFVAVVDDICNLNNPDLKMIIDDYIKAPFDENDILFRIELCIARANKVLETNPLTRLPGNITIIKEIQRRIDENNIFSLAYTDVDHFKPFNDKYGFSRGDEVIKMTGRLITNIAKIHSKESFVGHVGGDDFVFITSGNIDNICEDLISNFDSIIPTFYDPEDRQRGAIQSLDREGNIKSFPLITLSIGIAHNMKKNFSHYGMASQIATEMKTYAKKFDGSCYKIDRRHF